VKCYMIEEWEGSNCGAEKGKDIKEKKPQKNQNPAIKMSETFTYEKETSMPKTTEKGEKKKGGC